MSGLESNQGVYPFMEGDSVNQKKHAKRKQKWDELFQEGLKDEAVIQRELE